MRQMFALLLLLVALLLPLPASAEIRIAALPDDSDLDSFAWTVADPGELSETEKYAVPDSILELPYYELEVGNSSGRTTLFGLRNTEGTSINGVILYLDKSGAIRQMEVFTLGAKEVFTKNIRGVSGLTVDSDGIARGSIEISADNGAKMSGDYFLLNPFNDFASGGRLISHSDRCLFWDIRFLQGGAFTGGTTLLLFVDNPRGTDPGDPPSLAITVYDESGTIYGIVGVHMDQKVAELPMGSVLAALPGGIGPTFGSVWVAIGTSGGGYIQALYDADGRYSVNLGASCLD